jgi:hypothetical protein
MRAAAIDGLARLRVTRILPELRRIVRPWPFSRDPSVVKEAAFEAIHALETAQAIDESAGQPTP